MTKTVLAGGCSFTYGHELSDDDRGTRPSNKTWSAHLSNLVKGNYFCVARAGSGNSGIARRIFEYVSNTQEECVVVAMWSFVSRYDWAMPRHRLLENTRWTSITPWDTAMNQPEVEQKLAGSEVILDQFKLRREEYSKTNVGTFADSLYRYAANQYHETYLSWKSIVWLQHILEKKQIPFMFTLADNNLFYNIENLLYQDDPMMRALYKEIDFTKWFSFGERMMGFNQWATLNDYAYGTTHPLDEAHKDAAELMKEKFLTIYQGE
jgi:hypothetical protein